MKEYKRFKKFYKQIKKAKEYIEINKLLLNMTKNKKENLISIFQAISPLDYRYCLRNKKIINALSPYLSEEGFIKYLAKVESALVKVHSKRGVCSKSIVEEVANACLIVTAEEVYEEEDRIKHNIRALVNCIKKHISDSAKPFVHFTATSYDIIATADALRFKEFTNDALLGMLIELEKTLISIAEREKATLQIGRTHGQFAEPITYGFAIAQYVSRLGGRILEIERTANNLRGKFSGAVGAYNSLSLLFPDAEKFEEEIMNELGLTPSPISTQIAEPEYITDFMHSIISTFGVIANLADDMRHLQRSEISEIAEFFDDKQVGSSTMPQKRNPINFENVKSMWKTFS
ncbi:MAG: lyase family protein, partial [Nanoarchaeota archaeon]